MDRYPVRPWSDFADTTQFALPETDARFVSNVDYWLANYLLVTLGFVIAALLFGRDAPVAVGLSCSSITCAVHAFFRRRSIANMTRFKAKQLRRAFLSE